MNFIKCEKDGDVLVLTMCNGKANGIGSKMLDELRDGLAVASSESDIRGFVLASHSPKFFSGGFDVKEVFAYDRDQMREFFGRFIELYEGIYNLPKPTVAAINGHAYAGGAILALSCDYRIMAQADYGFAVNEINLGVAIPPGMARMAVAAVGFRDAYEILLTGEAITPARSLEIGLASQVARPEDLSGNAIAFAKSLATKPPTAFAEMKRRVRQVAGHPALESDCYVIDQFLNSWFSPEAEERKQALITALGNKQGSLHIISGKCRSLYRLSGSFDVLQDYLIRPNSYSERRVCFCRTP
jgi:3,2-trans-enoyl-CoA isomerase